MVLDDGQRVYPEHVSRHAYNYACQEMGTLHHWDSGTLGTHRGKWRKLEHVFKLYGRGVRRALVVLQASAML